MKPKRFLLLLFLAVAFTGCGKHETSISDLSMLKGGKTVAVPTGTAADQFVLKKVPDARIQYYNSVLDCALAVKSGNADAAVYDKPVLLNIAGKNEGLRVLSELLADDRYGFAVRMNNRELKTAIDEVLSELKANGTYDEMMQRWFPAKGSPAPMPDIKLDGNKGTLRFGTAAVTEPMSFVDGNRRIVGFDIEFASYVARKLGWQLQITDMEFGAMLPALISGKVDMIGAGLSITEERAKKVLFSESYYPSGIAVLVRENTKVLTAGKQTRMKVLDDIKDKRIGVLMGSIHDTYATKTFPGAQILQYQSVSDILLALSSGKIDAAFSDQAPVPGYLEKDPGLALLAKNVLFVPIAAGFNSDNDGLREQFNAFLKEIKSNGTYDDINSRWIEKGVTEMPAAGTKKVNGMLRVGVVNDLGMPFSFVQNGKLAGFDIELAMRFADYTGREFVPVPMQFGSLIASISTNKIDIITASMMITEEREKQIDFSDPYFETGVSVLARREDIESPGDTKISGTEKSFVERTGDSFRNNLIFEKRYLLILNGLKVTIIISVFAAILGTLLGSFVCYMRMSKKKLLRGIADGYISLLRGTPVLVLLMIVYYIFFASVNINPVFAAILAFGLNFAAYVSEIFRTAIESIDRGQTEAGIAGGFTKFQTFWYIILPQSLRRILPVYKGEFISLIKMTSIVGYVAVQDLTKAGDIIRSRTFDAFFPLIMVAVVYLIIVWLLTMALGYVEFSVDPVRKRSKSVEEAKR